MDIKFLGGAREVGSLGMLLDIDGQKMLFDYGFTASRPPKFPDAAPKVDFAFLSHCHIDHSGMIPWLCARYSPEVYTTQLTAELVTLLAHDTIKVSDLEGYQRPYEKGAIKTMEQSFRHVEFGETEEVGGVEATFHSAGHIPGAMMTEINASKTVLFTGDINNRDTELVGGAKPQKCDVLVMEGTYAGRDHGDRAQMQKDFLRKIDEVVSRGGQAIIPAFAVGRTQEIILALKDTKYDTWVDGMGKSVISIYKRHSEFLRSPKRFRQALRSVRPIRGMFDRQRAENAEVIITTSGMLDGGPALGYIAKRVRDTKSAIILTGYQVEECNGRRLLNEGKLDIDGTMTDVNCEVCQFDFSAHAGHSELLEFARGCEPTDIVLMHSDNPDLLAKELEGEFNVHMPKRGEEFSIK